MKAMEKVIFSIDPQGIIRCLYTEMIPLHALGHLKIQRLTHIEFDESAQQWEVHDLNGTVLYRSASRQHCLDWEQKHL